MLIGEKKRWEISTHDMYYSRILASCLSNKVRRSKLDVTPERTALTRELLVNLLKHTAFFNITAEVGKANNNCQLLFTF